jgi:hypothetical protein
MTQTDEALLDALLRRSTNHSRRERSNRSG